MSAPRGSAPPQIPPWQRRTHPVPAEGQPSTRGRRCLPLLALVLLGAGGLVLVLLVVGTQGRGMGQTSRSLSAAATATAESKAAPTGPIVEATEMTATPSHGEPTDVVPSSPGTSAAEGLGAGMPQPTQMPTTLPSTPTAAPTAVQITCAYAVNNDTGEVCVHTTPGAALNITVTYCSGKTAANSDLQGTRYADSFGNYTWTWVPETTCPGTAVAHVSASGNGGSSDATAPFPVSP